MNKTKLIITIILLTSTANALLWYDSDTTDSYQWTRRIPVILNETLGLERIDEPIIIQLKNISYSAIRIVDPQAQPDEEHEVGGNDIPYQINANELIFSGNVEAKKKKTYYIYLSDDPIPEKEYYNNEIQYLRQRESIHIYNQKASWTISEHGYYFSVTGYRLPEYNGSITASSGICFSERLKSNEGYDYLPAYGRNWNCSILDSGPIRLRINCSTNSTSYSIKKVFSFYSNTLFFDEEVEVEVLDPELENVRFESQSRVKPFFNQTNVHWFSRGEHKSDDKKTFYMAARDIRNSTGRFVFWVMGEGNYSEIAFSSGRDFDLFKYTLDVKGNTSRGRVRHLFREGDILTSRREYDRFRTKIYTLKPEEKNQIKILPLGRFDRIRDSGKGVFFAAEVDLIYGATEVICSLEEKSFRLYDTGEYGDKYPGDGIWSNNVFMKITADTPTGEYTVSCSAKDRKNNTFYSSTTFPVYDRGVYHMLSFIPEATRIRPGGISNLFVNVTNGGDFNEYDISFSVLKPPAGWIFSLPQPFNLSINESRRVSITLNAPENQSTGLMTLQIAGRSRDAFESPHKAEVNVELYDIYLKPSFKEGNLFLTLIGDDNEPIESAKVLFSLDNVTYEKNSGLDGVVSIKAADSSLIGVRAEKVGYKPLSVRISLRERKASLWFPITAAVIIILTLVVYWRYRELPGRDPLEDSFAFALVLGVVITLTWVGFTMRGPEAFTALYFLRDSYSSNLTGESTPFSYVVDCWEHKPTDYNVSIFLNNRLVDFDSFSLGEGDRLQPSVMEVDKSINVPYGLRLPARVRVVLTGGNKTLDIHYLIRGRFSEPNASMNLSCVNKVMDFDESDVDCGGKCMGCETGYRCNSDLDCLSGFCLNNKCTQPTCTDGIKNQNEVDTDCGGICLRCHCFNGIIDFDESDVDCGGKCMGCETGYRCNSDLDCLSGFCLNNKCTQPTCTDGIKNQNEVDTDCGGICRPCPSCFDGIQNQGELDIDCGGPCSDCRLFINRTRLIWVTQLDGFISSVALDSSRSFVAVASNSIEGHVSLLNSSDGRLLWTKEVPYALSDIDFVLSERFISPYPKSSIYLFDFNGFNRIMNYVKEADSFESMCGMSRSSDVFLEFNRSEGHWVYSVPESVHRVSHTLDCSMRAEGYKSSGNRSLVQLISGKKVLWSYSLEGDVYGVAVSANGSFTAAGAGGRRINEPNFLYLFDSRGRVLWKKPVDWNIYALALSHEGEFIYAGSRSGRISVFNSEGKLLWTYEAEGSILDVDVSSDGRVAVFGDSRGRIYYVLNPLVNCSDGVINMGESDVDCGGPCKPCEIGRRCNRKSDCVSGFCLRGICFEASCSDGRRNQGETGVDCGGPCKPCSPRCYRDENCGKETNSTYCYGNYVIFSRVRPRCVEPGTLDSFCELVNETVLEELCVEGTVCVSGSCIREVR